MSAAVGEPVGEGDEQGPEFPAPKNAESPHLNNEVGRVVGDAWQVNIVNGILLGNQAD